MPTYDDIEGKKFVIVKFLIEEDETVTEWENKKNCHFTRVEYDRMCGKCKDAFKANSDVVVCECGLQ
jgi:hypothetical protein